MMQIKYNKLSIKIMMWLSIVIFVITVFYAGMFTKYYGVYEDTMLGKESITTLYSIDASIAAVIETAKEYSKIILLDSGLKNDISYSYFDKVISSAIDFEEDTLFVLNKENKILYQGGDFVTQEQMMRDISLFTADTQEFWERRIIDNRMYRITGVENNTGRWKLIRYTPVHKKNHFNRIARYHMILLICSSILLLLISGVIVFLLTIPIQKLLSHMEQAKEGSFRRIEYVPVLEECRSLFAGYNQMASRIEGLLQGSLESKRRIRQVELNEIQEQMKPHFLYNTLDSIQALAMMGKTDKVCEVVEALEDFYRKSVSGGREFLTMQEEIQITQDYVDIMKIRFGDSFVYQLQVTGECENVLLPKLTIQPLVESTFTYGVQDSEKYSAITVCIIMEEKELHISVTDNGKRDAAKSAKELKHSERQERRKNLGVRGVIERLQIIYGEAFSFEILRENETEIHLHLAKEGLRWQKTFDAM